MLVSAEALSDERGTKLQGQARKVDRLERIHAAGLALAAGIGRGRVLTLCETVAAVIHHDIDHVEVTAHSVHELSHADRCRITVTGHTKVDEVLVDHVGTGGDRWHAAVHGVESVRLAKEVGRRLGGAADAGHLGNAMRFEVQLETGMHNCSANTVVTTAGTQRRE